MDLMVFLLDFDKKDAQANKELGVVATRKGYDYSPSAKPNFFDRKQRVLKSVSSCEYCKNEHMLMIWPKDKSDTIDDVWDNEDDRLVRMVVKDKYFVICALCHLKSLSTILRRKGSVPHGTPKGYNRWRCRCPNVIKQPKNTTGDTSRRISLRQGNH